MEKKISTEHIIHWPIFKEHLHLKDPRLLLRLIGEFSYKL